MKFLLYIKIIDSIKWMKNILVSNKQEICSRNILELNDDTDEKVWMIFIEENRKNSNERSSVK